jgi:hypothetical protein|tara:strand:- start:498 stop:899 length:402 start_codon:yes stop_codon:yes gene_type:complete
MKIALAALFALSACTPAVAGDYQPGYSASRTCFKTEYREEYVPGTEFDPGYVKSWKETVEVPCGTEVVESKVYKRHVTVIENVDTNDCSDGTVAGALLGGGLAGFGTRGKDRWWTIPTGIIGGAMLGCAVDGG